MDLKLCRFTIGFTLLLSSILLFKVLDYQVASSTIFDNEKNEVQVRLAKSELDFKTSFTLIRNSYNQDEYKKSSDNEFLNVGIKNKLICDKEAAPFYGQLFQCIDYLEKTIYYIYRGTSPASLTELWVNIVPLQIICIFFVLLCVISLSYFKVPRCCTFVAVSVLSFFSIMVLGMVDYSTLKYKDTALSLFYYLDHENNYQKIIKEHQIKNIVFLGHSKGGAEATFLFEDFFDKKICSDSTICTLITFGAPKVIKDVNKFSKYNNRIFQFIHKADVALLLTNFSRSLQYIIEPIFLNPWGLVLEFIIVAIALGFIWSSISEKVLTSFRNYLGTLVWWKRWWIVFLTICLLALLSEVFIYVYSLITFHNAEVYFNYMKIVTNLWVK